MIESAYETLKVNRNASPEEVRAAFVKLVRRYPPENFPKKFNDIQTAYRQICVDDDLLMEAEERLSTFGTERANIFGFLWGDRKELAFDGAFDVSSLKALFWADARTAKLDALLDSICESGVEWLDYNPKEK